MLTSRCQHAVTKARLSKAFASFRYYSSLDPLLPSTTSNELRSSYLETSRKQLSSKRSFGTSSQPEELDKSIFATDSSAWDHVFNDIKSMPPLLPSTNNRSNHNQRPSRRQTMTAREISAFDDMFNLIFSAVSEQRIKPSSDAPSEKEPEIGYGRDRMGDLFGKLRQHSKRVKWTTESDEFLDRKKEEMDLCDTDQQLLEWAMREVFGESIKYTEAAKQAEKESTVAGKKSTGLPQLQPPAYPHLIALLMRAFRDKYHDPNLSLSIFEHARHLSIPSYVFGCSTLVYNELIETRWRCFRDLKGVHNALEEMTVNGVESDSKTLQLLETLRREAAEGNLWQEESEVGSGEVLKMLGKIESLLQQAAPRTKARKSPTSTREKEGRKRLNEWKTASLSEDEDDWVFGKWEKPARNSKSRVPKSNSRLRKPVDEDGAMPLMW